MLLNNEIITILYMVMGGCCFSVITSESIIKYVEFKGF